MSALIYIATNTINGKEYVGFTTETLDQRRGRHFNKAKRAEGNQHFYRAIRKYGEDAFEWSVLFEHDDEKWTLKVMEPYFIAWHDTYESGYNMTKGGDGSFGLEREGWNKGQHLTEDHRKAISEAKKGKPSPLKGRKTGPLSDDHRRKLREAWARRKARK